MTKQIIATTNAPAVIGPYSQATQAGNFLFISGQLPLDPQSGLLITDAAAATTASLNNVKAIVEGAGAFMSDIVKTTIFVADLNNFAAINQAYNEFFAMEPPARSCVQVAAIPKGAVVEIEAIAFISEEYPY